MKRSRIHILIVDDDNTQGKALLEAFNRAGYKTTWTDSSVKALSMAQRQEFHVLLVDCMLPKMNGLDLVEEILNIAPRRPKVFLITGIYKDRNFQKEAADRTHFDDFFIKPLDLEQILSAVGNALGAAVQVEEPALTPLYGKDTLNDEALIRLLNEETSIQGLHLPMLLKHMQKGSLSGELSITNEKDGVATVSFFDGRIFAVRTPDKESFFGGLAVGFGFVSPDEVAAALQSGENKLIGRKLIESLSLSPHAINLILEEQLALRLSQCVQNGIVNLSWRDGKYSPPEYTLNLTRYDGLVEDWLQSKLDPSFVNGWLNQCGACVVHGEFHPTIQKADSLASLVAHPDFDSSQDTGYLYRQLMRREAFIGTPNLSNDHEFEFLETRLDQMLSSFPHLNHFQILGIGESAKNREMNKAFEDLSSFFHPERLPSNCPPALVAKCTRVFQMIETAYQVLTNDIERGRYLSILENKRRQALLENEPLFQMAVSELQNGQARSAGVKLQSLIDRKLEFKHLRAYRIWAGLKVDRTYNSITLDQVPPEERHSTPYLIAKGLYHRYKGQYRQALEALRTAHALDSRNKAAKNELKKLIEKLERSRSRNRDLLSDMTSVVESLFGKKTKRGA